MSSGLQKKLIGELKFTNYASKTPTS